MRVWEVIATVLFYLTLPFFYLERVIHKKSGGWKKKFGFCDSIPEGKVIMLHGCSVGEITAVEDLAKRIKKEFGYYKWYRRVLIKSVVKSFFMILKTEYIKPFLGKG